MKSILMALINPMNLLILFLTFFVTVYLNNSASVLIFIIGIILYILGVFQKINYSNLSNELKSNTISEIKKLNNECEELAQPLKNSTNYEKRDRIRNVLKYKNEVMEMLFKDKDRLLKQKIAKQTIELVRVYIDLLSNYFSRKEDIENTDLDEISNKIKENEEKLKSTEDVLEKQQIEEIIELNKRILQNSADEKNELENIISKIDYIESSIKLFKQQMMSNNEGEEVIQDVQNIVNEAVALNNVINNRKKQRL